MSARARRALKWMWLSLGGLFVLALAVAWLQDEAASWNLKPGQSYAVAKEGIVCADQDNLAAAEENQARPFLDAHGCAAIGPSDKATVESRDAALVKVLVAENGGNIDVGGFEGWTEAENLAQPSR